MRVEPEVHAPTSSTTMGDWYANLLYTRRGQLILAVSERTLLPVLVPAAEAKSFPMRLTNAVAEVLQAIGISAEAIDREIAEMSPITIARTANRSVLGILSEFAFAASIGLERDYSLVGLAVWLAETPCKPIKMDSPDRVTKAAFAESLH
jgi:hypothetical protein